MDSSDGMRPEDTRQIGVASDTYERVVVTKTDVASHWEKVLRWHDYMAFALLSTLCAYAVWRFVPYWASRSGWQEDPFIYAVVTLTLLMVSINNQGQWLLLFCMKRPLPLPARSGWRVAVITTFVPEAEPLEMLEHTLSALVALDYPHDTWVLDEGDDERVRALCQRLGAHHFSRKHVQPTYRAPVLHAQTGNETFKTASKHGNYNVWLYTIGFTRYDIVSIFDPDHVPATEFLDKVLGYFDDPNVAYVQAAPAYYNQRASFIARGAAEETYDYHSFVQMASYGMGYPIIVGSHSTHRVAALQQVGGLAPHDADDILLTLFYRLQGWRGVYVPEILARGLTPVDWSGYLTQQRRWARSVLDIKLRLHPQLSQDLSWTTRVMSLLHGVNYLHRSFLIFGSLLLLAAMLVTGQGGSCITDVLSPQMVFLAGALQLCGLYRQKFYLDWRTERGFHWRVVLLHLGKWPYMLLALGDFVTGKKTPYAITKKIQSTSKNPRRTLFLPHILMLLLLGSAWSIGTVTGQITHTSLHLTAMVVIAALLGIVLSGYKRFPQPYMPQQP